MTLISLCVISYNAYLNSAHSPTALKEKRRRGKKIALWKIIKGPKMQNFKKNPLKHCKTALKEYFIVFFCLALKKMHSAQQEKTHNHVWRTLLQRLMR